MERILLDARRAGHHHGLRGVGHRTAALRAHAALVNGTLVQASNSTTCIAPVCVWARCAAGVVRRHRAAAGRRPRFPAAAVAGYEISRGRLCMGRAYRQGWHSGATVGVFSAAAGAARAGAPPDAACMRSASPAPRRPA
jgi:hypothetical protein